MVDYTPRMADSFDRLRPHQGERFEFWLRTLQGLADLKPGMRCLDIGCGTGRYSIPLSERTGASIVGLDRSQVMLEKAREKSQRVEWVEGDAERLPFEDGAFDVGLMVYVIHQVPDKPIAIREAGRVIREGGRLLVMTTAPENITRNPILANFPGLLEIELERFPTIEQLEAWMTDAGFGSVEVRTESTGPQSMDVEEYIAWARERPISTLDLVPEGEFEERSRTFAERLRARGGTVHWEYRGTFVIGTRAGRI